MVERFRIWAHDCDPEITPDERGGWVTHFDYAALESNVATLLAENDQLRRELDAIRNETIEEAARRGDAWDNPSALSLAAGEMTAQELRTARAVARGIAAAIRNLKE